MNESKAGDRRQETGITKQLGHQANVLVALIPELKDLILIDASNEPGSIDNGNDEVDSRLERLRLTFRVLIKVFTATTNTHRRDSSSEFASDDGSIVSDSHRSNRFWPSELMEKTQLNQSKTNIRPRCMAPQRMHWLLRPKEWLGRRSKRNSYKHASPDASTKIQQC